MKQLKRSECAVLPLVIKGKWYDMIASGEKKEEYRDDNPFWAKRIHKVYKQSRDYDTIMVIAFSKRCKKYDMFFVCDYAMGVGEVYIKTHKLKTEWGQPNSPHVILAIGERVELVD